MNSDFYFFGRVFLGLGIFCGLLQSVLFFFFGRELFSVLIFPTWFLVATMVQQASSLFILRYYAHKKYFPAFVTGMCVVIAIFFQAVVVFTIAVLKEFYIPAAYVVAGTGLAYSLTLIFSKAGERVWLRRAGFVILALTVVNIAVFAIVGKSPAIASTTVVKMYQWTSFVGILVPIFYIINFLKEEEIAKSVAMAGQQHTSKLSDALLSIALISAFLLSTIVGYQLVAQSVTKGAVSIEARLLSQQFEARTYVSDSGESMSYRLLRPLDYDSAKRYPLAVCLHGGAGWGTDNIRQLDGAMEAKILSSAENRKKYPAFLFVPQCPTGTSWGGVPGLKNVDSLVFEIIDSLEREFSIDTHRRYVMGHSLGGFGAWYFIGTRPEMFAAAVPAAGFGDPKFAKNIVDVPIWAFHGRLDRNAPVSGSRDIIEAIRREGGHPKYTEYPHIGHGTADVMKNNKELMDWIFEQRRD